MSKKKKKKRSATRIALCMIVKNEAANLERCLKSVRGLVSETNIVDTGSEDNTVEIARRLGAHVRSEQWTNDFSHARNISLDMAKAEWILILDADEVLAAEAVSKIKAAVTRPDTVAYMLPTRNYTDDSEVGGFVANDGSFPPARSCKGWVESRKIRLFRKLPGIRFEGEIHEVVGPSIMRSGGRVEALDAVVHHFGHMASRDSLRKKFDKLVPIAEAKCESQKDDFKAHYELGVILAQLGEFERAERSLRKSVTLRSDFALSHYDLGVLLSRTGREEEALSEFRAASRIDPDNIDAVNNLADSLQRLRRDEEAEHIYRAVLEKHPHYARSWSNLGALLARTGRLDEAEDAFNKALAIDPDFADAQSNLRKLQGMKSGKSQQPSETTEKAHLPGTITLCMIVKNEEQRLAGLLEQATRAVDEVIIVDTGSTDDTAETARRCGAKVYAFNWTDNFADARNYSLSKAASEWIFILDADESLQPDDFAALRELIRDTRADGFSFETRNYSQESGQEGWRPVQEEDAMARSFPGWLPSEKVRLFRNAPSIKFEGAVHELVEPSILRANGRIERAQVPIHHYGYDSGAAKADTYLAPARQKAAADPESAQAHFELGAVLHRTGQFEEARASFEKAVERAPDNAEYRVALGDSLRATGHFADAERSYKQAIEINSEFSSAHRGLGIALYHQGAIDASEREFKEALRLNPKDAQSLTNLGVVAVGKGNIILATDYFKQALDINPRNAVARENLKKLSETSDGSTTLGLIMIVRNERENLSEMLPKFAGCFDEIVIVDTGSEDDTVTIAKSYTAKVFGFKWTDDFSAARNYALAHSEADWILWLDADDRINPEDIALLRKNISGERKAFLLRVLSGKGDSSTGEFLQIRLFPNIEGIKWEGRVHEQILPSLEKIGAHIEALSQPLIVHTGYDDPAILEKKTRRNVALLEQDRKLRPDDPIVLHHLGQAYTLLGDIQKAIEVSEALVRLHGSRPPNEFLTHTMNRLAQYQLMRNDVETARMWADRLLKIEPDNRLIRYFLGEICYRKNMFDEAIKWFERFCNAEDVVGCVPIPWKKLRVGARNYLGLCYDRTGNREKAQTEFRKAIEEGNKIEPYKNLAHILLQEGKLEEAESVLRDALNVNANDIDLWINLGVALARSRRLGEAEEIFCRAVELDPLHELARKNLEEVRKKISESAVDPLKKSLHNLKMLSRELAEKPRDPSVLLALGREFLACGQPQHAAKWLRTLWTLRDEHDDGKDRHTFWMAAILLFDCELRSGREADADTWLERAREIAPQNWLAYFLLGERKFLSGNVEDAAPLLAKAAELGIEPTPLTLDTAATRNKLNAYMSELRQKSVCTPSTVSGGARHGEE